MKYPRFMAGNFKKFWITIAGSFVAAVAFILLTSAALDGQGFPFDETPVAPASFLMLGKVPYPPLTVLQWHGIPLLTVTYIGAAKSHLFGLFMKCTGVPFSVPVWRMFGIVIIAAGIFLFGVIASTRGSRISWMILAFLLLTDCTVLLYGRLDCFPMAISLFCRLLWIGLWLRQELSRRWDAIGTFLLGAIPAFLVYEKLNNAVFILPLAAALFLTPERRTRKNLFILTAGICIGAVPFILVNALTDGISFHQIGSGSSIGVSSRMEFLKFLKIFLGMGAGQEVKNFVFGSPIVGWIKYTDVILTLSLLVIGGILAYRQWKNGSSAKVFMMAVLSYFGIGIGTWLIPKGTGIHHWIVSAPFQYLALAMIIPLLQSESSPTRKRAVPRLAVSALAVLCLVRLCNVIDTEARIANRECSNDRGLDYTRVTQYFASHYHEANFIAADYGFGGQTYCFSQGEYVMPEPFWNYQGREQLNNIIKQSKALPVYIVYNDHPTVLPSPIKMAIVNDLHALLGTSPLPLEPELRGLKGIVVEKYSYPHIP